MENNHKLPILIIGLVLIVVVLIVGILIPVLASDNLANYQGIKKDAASDALTFDVSAYSPALFANLTKAQVESVVPTSPASPMCKSNPSEVEYYTVTIRRVWLFGTTYGTQTYDLCKAIG